VSVFLLKVQYGQGGELVNPGDLDASSIGSLPRIADIQFNSNGTITVTGQSGKRWFSKTIAGIGSGYDVRCASISGGAWDSTPAGTGTWIDMSTDRRWRITRTTMEGSGADSVACVFELRTSGGGAAEQSCDATAYAGDS